MTDVQKSSNPNDTKFNVYFQNKRIRQHLFKAGLIDPYGVILPPISKKAESSARVSRRHTRDKASASTEKYAGKEKQRDQVDSLTKQISKEKPKISKPSRRNVSRSLSAVVRPPSTTNQKHSSRRLESAHHSVNNSKKRLVRSFAKIKSPPTKDHCRVVMIYYGSQTNPDYDHSWCQPEGDEIVVSQQHCGGENLIVFKGFVKPHQKFLFNSRRHQDYPFGLALYINGLASSRISVCCEYRHKRNVPLGGEQGLFGIVSVRGGKSCSKCQHKKQKKKCKSAVSFKLEPPHDQKSIVPRASSRSSSDNRSRTPSPPHHHPSAKPHSPDITRTPSPLTKDNRRVSSTSSNASAVPIGHNSNIQKSVALQNNNENNYSSDFDESDEDLPTPSTLQSDQPHVSDSRAIGNQRKGRKSSESSFNNEQLQKQIGKNETAGFKRTSDPIDEKNTDQLSKVLPSGINNGVNPLSSSSSSISKKSAASHKHEIKRVSDERNDKEQNRFSSTVRPKTAGRDRQSSTSSIERAFVATSVKQNGDNHHSTETDVNLHRLSTSSSENFLGLKRSSSNQQAKASSNTRYEKVKKTDSDESERLNLESAYKTRSWFEDNDSDHNSM